MPYVAEEDWAVIERERAELKDLQMRMGNLGQANQMMSVQLDRVRRERDKLKNQLADAEERIYEMESRRR